MLESSARGSGTAITAFGVPIEAAMDDSRQGDIFIGVGAKERRRAAIAGPAHSEYTA